MLFFSFFFFNDTATTEIYTLSLHDALPILEPHLELARIEVVPLHPRRVAIGPNVAGRADFGVELRLAALASHELRADRKSTRLNSSHGYISYAVFCLKKKKTS